MVDCHPEGWQFGMDRDPVQRESFIVRVWWQQRQVTPEVWVQHIRSGESAIIHDLKDVIAFIERWTPRPAAKDGQGLR